MMSAHYSLGPMFSVFETSQNVSIWPFPMCCSVALCLMLRFGYSWECYMFAFCFFFFRKMNHNTANRYKKGCGIWWLECDYYINENSKLGFLAEVNCTWLWQEILLNVNKRTCTWDRYVSGVSLLLLLYQIIYLQYIVCEMWHEIHAQ